MNNQMERINVGLISLLALHNEMKCRQSLYYTFHQPILRRRFAALLRYEVVNIVCRPPRETFRAAGYALLAGTH